MLECPVYLYWLSVSLCSCGSLGFRCWLSYIVFHASFKATLEIRSKVMESRLFLYSAFDDSRTMSLFRSRLMLITFSFVQYVYLNVCFYITIDTVS